MPARAKFAWRWLGPRGVVWGCLAICAVGVADVAHGCPFCTALGPTWSQERERATVVLWGELRSVRGTTAEVVVRQVLKSPATWRAEERLEVHASPDVQPGALVLLSGRAAEGETGGSEPDAAPNAVQETALEWKVERVDEASLAYVVRSPGENVTAGDRLAYFARFLEHPSERLAEDAYLEFGHAPLDVVRGVAGRVSSAKLRQWIADPRVPERRKGLYGLLLGLAEAPAERVANAAFLRAQIEQPAVDFRSSFDGLLGGYLWLEGETALVRIEERILSNPQSADGDVRHAQTALRFYEEFGRQIPSPRLSAALAHLLDRPEFAASAVVDLARWQAWEHTDRVAALFDREGYPQPATRRAVVGYLLVSPGALARDHLVALRARDAAGVAEAEAYVEALGGVR